MNTSCFSRNNTGLTISAFLYEIFRSLGRLRNQNLWPIVLVGSVIFWHPSTSLSQTNTAPLIEEGDLVYEGAFRVPGGGTDTNTFAYGGTAIAYNNLGNSLFIVGHDHKQRTAEISIPNIVNSTNINDLDTASILQPFTDSTEGRLNQINPSDPNPQKIGGQLVHNNRLVQAAYSYYDGAGTQESSHFARPLSLGIDGQVQGPYAVGSKVQYTGGYMAQIPVEWQAVFGGPALTGSCCKAIISIQSNGPAVSVFDPDDIGRLNPVPAIDLLHYTVSDPLGPGYDTQNPYWNLTTRITGLAFPVGTRSILFFGEHGIGPYCYGTGAECSDPADPYKGTHGFPYKYQIWGYDANDLIAVKNGSTLPYDVLPYKVWFLEMPFVGDSSKHEIGGVAYDPGTNRVFVAQLRGDGTLPVIHAFTIDRALRPSAPQSLLAE